jgi:hypothetical protein
MYSWTITSAGNDWLITNGATTNSITYTSGSSGPATFKLVVTNAGSGCMDSCTIVVNCTPPYIGCTLGFWKTHTSLWNETSDPISLCLAGAISGIDGTSGSLFMTTFGLTSAQMTAAGLDPTMTLIQALNLGGGSYRMLARQGTASLINSCALAPNFPYSTSQVITMIHDAIVNLNAEPAASQLAAANEAQPDKCPAGGPANPNGITLNAYPNPFVDQATIEVSTSYDYSHVVVQLYNIHGEAVSLVFNGSLEANQTYSWKVDGTNLPEGIYFYRVNANNELFSGKIVLMRN